jgi:hypothetical protein
MNRDEEELQNSFDAGKNPEGEALDIKAYQSVFKALQTEPEFILSSAFADKVVATAMQKQQSRSFLSTYFWFGMGIVLLLIAFIVAIALTDFKLDFGFLNGLSSHKGVIVFGIFFIGLLHWLDKQLLKPLMRN